MMMMMIFFSVPKNDNILLFSLIQHTVIWPLYRNISRWYRSETIISKISWTVYRIAHLLNETSPLLMYTLNDTCS